MSRHSRSDAGFAADTAPAPWLAELLRERALATVNPGRHAAMGEASDLMEAATVPFAALRVGSTDGDLDVTPVAGPTPASRFGRRSRARRIGLPVAVGAAAVLCLLPLALGSTTSTPAAAPLRIPAPGKAVSIVVDGHLQKVMTAETTVSAVLAAAGIAPGPHDIVAPSGVSTVIDGSVIVLDRGRRVILTVDGRQQVAWTSAHTVRAALDQFGVHAGGGVQLRVSMDLAAVIPLTGVAVSAVTERAVSIRIAGAPAVVRTSTAKTVKAVLAEQHVTLGPLDRVNPGLPTPVTAGLVIMVDRVRTTTVSHARTVAQPADITVNDEDLDQGTTEVSQAGRPGRETVTDQVTWVNGAAKSSAPLSWTLVSAPTATVVHVGTRVPDPGSEAAAIEAATHFTYQGDEVLTHDITFGVNWDGLSMCESTHNPKAINADPSAGLPTYGLFQFDLPTWESVGGSGNPIDATPQEQLMRAKLLYEQRNLEPWACRDSAH